MRTVARLLLVVAGVAAAAVAVVALARLGVDETAAWATVAAALAVLATVVSAWSGQRVLELQEDAREPHVVPLIDLRSRYQIAQFRVSNQGQSPAFDVRIQWERQLLNAEGKPVAFAADVPIPIIPPAESASVTLGTSNDFITSQADTTYRGSLTFKNASGRSRSVQFVVSAEYERTALAYDEERPRTEFQLQRLPEELRRVSDQLDRLGRIAERRGEGRAVEQRDEADDA